MNKPEIKISVTDTIKNTIQAMERVTSAVLGGNPAGAGAITGKKVTAQFSFNMRDSGIKGQIEEAAHRKIVSEAFEKNAITLENAIRNAVEDVVENMIGYSNKNIQVMGRSLGKLTSSENIENEPFARFIRSKEGAGEIGLPDPNESIETLKVALVAAIKVDVIVRKNGPQVKLKFDQRKLLKLTPHPDQFESGEKGPFFSWLSLVTGPDLIKNIAGYSFVSVREISNQLSKKSSGIRSLSRKQFTSAKALNGLLAISRTRGYAGDFAGVMLRNKKNNGKKSTAEFAGGSNQDYSPSKQFPGFWDKWWLQRKQEMSIFIRRIMGAAVRGVLGG